PADPLPKLGQAWKQAVNLLILASPFRSAYARDRHRQVFRDRQVGKDLVSLGYQHDAARGDVVRWGVLDPSSHERNHAFRYASIVEPQESRDRAPGRGLAGAVNASARHAPVRPDRQRAALHGGNRALVDALDFFNLEQSLIHLRAPASGRYLKGQSRK